MREAEQLPLDDRQAGKILIEAIRLEMAARQISAAKAAEECGLGYKYFSALMTGGRLFAHLKHEHFSPIAKFLRTSVIQIMVWAGLIGLEDFHNNDSLPYLLQVSYIKMRNDPHWGMLLPSNDIWEAAPIEMKIPLILMYEKLVGDVLLDKVNVGPVIDLSITKVPVQQAFVEEDTQRKTPQR